MGLNILFAFSVGVASGIGFCWLTFLLVCLAAHDHQEDRIQEERVLIKEGIDPRYWYEPEKISRLELGFYWLYEKFRTGCEKLGKMVCEQLPHVCMTLFSEKNRLKD